MKEGNLISMEMRKGRHRLTLSKSRPGSILASLHPTAPFFYRVEIDGKLMRMTHDPMEARKTWRTLHRWLMTGRTATASVL